MIVWRQSRKDAYLMAVAAFQTAVFAIAFWLHTHGAGTIQWLLGGLIVFLICTNIQCVAHNFLHLPFFRPRWMNSAFALWNTLLLGAPQTIYKYQHLNHHRYINDYRGADGTTRDVTSFYRYSPQPDQPESLIRYALLSPLRLNPVPLYRTAVAHGQAWQVYAELLVLIVVLAAVAWTSPSFFVRVYLPTWYLGYAVAYAQNYFEHFGAQPGNHFADSVSSYCGWYNWVWFNNGYHQEHHWKPQVHWTQVPLLRQKLPSAEARPVITYSHWFNWPVRTSLIHPKPR